jgi:large subunit ribosomal protein L15
MSTQFNKRKKNSRQRGSSSHGWGAKKKHRGAGHRGGRGKAGSGKRGDSKKPSYWKNTKFHGKTGFTSKSRIKISAITLTKLNDMLEKFISKGLAIKQNDAYSIDLAKIKKNKLLSTGVINKKLNITTQYASKKAVAKVEKAGGKVTVLEPLGKTAKTKLIESKKGVEKELKTNIKPPEEAQ